MKNLIMYRDGTRKAYHATFKTEHGRRVYLHISVVDIFCAIDGCFYIDRVKRPAPKKLITQACELAELPQVLRTELDTPVEGIELCEDAVSKEELILAYQSAQKKRILIMLDDGKALHTVFKSKFRRTIHLEILREGDVATISNCYYVDPRGKDLKISPQGLITVRFPFALHNLLEVVNCELEGGFSDVLVTRETTVELTDTPICGSI